MWTERMLKALDTSVKGGVWYSLIDKVYAEATLRASWMSVRRNGGSGGTDCQSVADFERRLDLELGKLREELREGRYHPRPIRRVYIDKPGGAGQRPLGIPCVRDRVVQGAVRLVIEPILEREFAEHSYGFRPGRGCKDALRRVDALLKSGSAHVVDADVRAYFDSIPHEPLMAEVRTRVADGRVLGLIEGFLKQGILDGCEEWTPEAGTPQGAVLSPLLANLYLHAVDVAMAREGYEMVRYADDFVILCRSRKEAEAALARVDGLLGERGLRLHPDKTRLVDVLAGEGFDFLGYRFEGGERSPRAKSLGRFKDGIRQATRRTDGRSLRSIIDDLTPRLRGWFNYYKHVTTRIFGTLDAWIRRRLRGILRRRMGLRGISRGADHQRWRNAFFAEQGLFSLDMAHARCLQPTRG